ncbi:hypothetical protein K1T71_011520 [Dendrolimus kikuchii]|uniref:Uncharacterized protein n=1 Tax=Dendrolimus kikuchii TaxID=765133 RepID=A0ACC1CP01_9NEOP|nr:hypothetical protein K1T71_011520 [Dendrolimus kikuchii]
MVLNHCFNILVFTIIIQFSYTKASFFPNLYPRIKLSAKPFTDAGNPLILTPYIKQGAIELAQNLSQVPLTEKIGFRSYAGFFTIDSKYNSNLYFWYFPPFSKITTAPVVLWLQGGPGGSSLFGLFEEIGPIRAKKGGFALRKYHWSLNYHLIFIDNPVGTGFSFTDDDNGYCKDETCIGAGLYNAMQQFYMLFPNLRSNDFYITGESYAGKYIPALGITIHTENLKGEVDRINLKGMAIGNGYCDPINQLDYGNYLYQHGLIDDNQRSVFEKYQGQIMTEIKQGNWQAADILMDKLMDGEMTNFSYFKEYTGYQYYYNFLKTNNTEDMSIFTNLLQNDNVRRSVHVGGLPFNDGELVQLHLVLDLLQSMAQIISELLNHYRIMFYNGQLDIVVAYPLTINFLHNLNFSSAVEYETAERKIWRVGDEIAGYAKKAGNLTDVLVRNAGHMVPADQPKWAFNLITRFINNKL